MRRLALLVVTLAIFFLLAPALAWPDSQEPPAQYRLRFGTSSFQQGCFGRCLCPVSFLPLDGTFLLTFDGFDGLFQNFTITDVNWMGHEGSGEFFPSTGSGHYRVGGEFASEHQLTLELQVGDDPVQEYDSGLVVGGGNFPQIDIAISISGTPGFACYDMLFEVSARPAQELTVSRDSLSWTPVLAATGYDVIKGDGRTLRNSGGDFSEATQECLADDLYGTSLDLGAAPGPHEVFWYLLRYNHTAGAGTYDSDSLSQAGSRDPGISSSPSPCP